MSVPCTSLSGLEVARFVCLSTAQRDGTAVPTPLGPVWQSGRLFFYTPAASGKIKRIRNDPVVQVAACTRSGVITGPWHDARATS